MSVMRAPATVDDDRYTAARDFLDRLTAKARPDCQLELWNAATRRSAYFGSADLDGAARLVAESDGDVYVNSGASASKRPAERRMSASDVEYALAAVADLDVKSGAFTSKDAARAFLDTLV
ncbi:MAG: hypothetical protein JOZ75_06360, partial [Candidatus Dormibacteraeota bacterium]|nr:hypothetical protein [Candidatus Dormibacteraeota bacterium]